MTRVGQILLFLNLVFSLVVGGFAVVDYTARTHWHTSFEKLKKDYETLHRANGLYKTEAERLAKEKETLYSELHRQNVAIKISGDNKEDLANAGKKAVAALENQAKTITTLEKRTTGLSKELADAKGTIADLTASQKAYQVTIDSRQTDATLLRDNLKKEVDKNFQLTRDINDATDKRVQAEIKARTMEDYNRRLLARVTELEKLKASGGVAGRATAPPQDVEGLVRRAEGSLVTISLGADNGLARGQTLEVFRLGNNARYIGKIRIETVTPTQAVGTVVGRVTTPIQVGDHVASRIISNN